MSRLNLVPLRSDDPFEWSTNLDGYQFWLNFLKLGGTKRRTWKAAGKALRYYLAPSTCPEPYHHRNIVAHSHGLQVVLYAAYYGLKIRTLVSVGSPLREDVFKEVGLGVIGNIGSWLHISNGKDKYGRLGRFNDGKVNWPWQQHHVAALADFNDSCESHTDVLEKKDCIARWDTDGWADFLRYGTLRGHGPRDRAAGGILDTSRT